MPTFEHIKEQYGLNDDEITKVIFTWQQNSDKFPFINAIRNSVDNLNKLSFRELVQLWSDLRTSNEIREIAAEARRIERKKNNSAKTLTEAGMFSKEPQITQGTYVIVSKPNTANIRQGTVVVVDEVKGGYVIFTKNHSKYAVEVEAVKPIVSESVLKTNIPLKQKDFIKKYLELMKMTGNHNKILVSLTKKYNMSLNEAEQILFPECGNLKNIDEHFSDDLDDMLCEEDEETEEKYPEMAEYNERYEKIAEDVLVYLIRNSNYHKKLYDTLEDAVEATLTFLKLSDEIGPNGTNIIVDIIKQKYLDNKSNENNELPIEEDVTVVDKINENEVDGNIKESVMKIGSPNYWASSKNHIIACFYDKLITGKMLDEMKKNIKFSMINEEYDRTLLYFNK